MANDKTMILYFCVVVALLGPTYAENPTKENELLMSVCGGYLANIRGRICNIAVEEQATEATFLFDLLHPTKKLSGEQYVENMKHGTSQVDPCCLTSCSLQTLLQFC